MKEFRLMALVPLLMMLLSAWVGGHRYMMAKEEMRQDLNRALSQFVLDGKSNAWLCESLPALSRNGVFTPAGQLVEFRQRLSCVLLKDTAHFSCCLFQPDASVGFSERAMVSSDTLFCQLSPEEADDAVIALKAFANPSVASVFYNSRQMFPLSLFFVGLLWLGTLFMRRPRSFSLYPAAELALNLTPMQEQLMELFYAAPEHTLTKEQICEKLWPRKENPETTLYTFISRLKNTLRQQSNLRIENRRGKEYVLKDDSVDG